MSPNDFSWKESEKELVAEQSGLGISLIGLFLALFIGMAVRAVVAPEKVQGHLQKAISHIHPDLNISFSEAYVSFANGSLPDLAVVIRGGVVASDKKCWMSPVMEINEMRLPLSWSHLLRGEIYIHQVIVDQVNLNLRGEPTECAAGGSKDASTPRLKDERTPAQFSTQQAPAQVVEFKNVRRKNPIDTVLIENLKINYLPIAFTSVEIRNFRAYLKSHEPRWFEVTGLLNLSGDMLTGEAGSYANLKIDALDGENASIAASAKGVWREGHYDLQVTAQPKKDQFTFSLVTEHVPVSQIIPLLKKYRLMNSSISGKQSWISGKATTSGKISQINQTGMDLSQIRLEGEMGEFSLAHAHLESLNPLRYDPLEFQIKALNIKKFLEFLGKSHPLPTFGNLGVFNGAAIFEGPEDLKIRGDYSNLEFIFSNRGSRQIQTLGLISGELALKDNQWIMNLDRIRPVDGIFEGLVHVRAQKDFKSVSIDAKIRELSLSPQVQILMTGGGSLGSLDGRLQAQFARGQLRQLEGQLRWDQVLIEGLRLYRPQIHLSSQGDQYFVDLKAQELELQKDHVITGNLFLPVTEKLVPNSSEKSFKARSLTAKMNTTKFQELQWKSLSMNAANGTLKSQGAWNKEGVLSGDILFMLGNGNSELKWQISGDRSRPILTGPVK